MEGLETIVWEVEYAYSQAESAPSHVTRSRAVPLYDADAATVSLDSPASAVTEGETFTLPIALSGEASFDVYVGWELDLTEVAGRTSASEADFESGAVLAGVARIPAGTRTVEVSVPVLDDRLAPGAPGTDMETEEWFQVNLTGVYRDEARAALGEECAASVDGEGLVSFESCVSLGTSTTTSVAIEATASTTPGVFVTGGAGLTAGESATRFTADEGASVTLTASVVGIDSPAWAWSQSEEDEARVLGDGVATDSNELSLTLPAWHEDYTLALTVTATPSGGGEARSARVLLEVSNTNGICDRTQQVRDEIVELISGVSRCEDVDSDRLAALTGLLDLHNKRLRELKEYDFAGLSSLTQLGLSGSTVSPDTNALTELPAGLFNGLRSLEGLSLHANALTTLPAGLFAGLGRLRELTLQDNAFTTLPAGLFDDLGALYRLQLENNALTTLPAGLFDDLHQLDGLTLQHNALTTLPSGLFQSLSGGELNLDHNDLVSLPADLFRGGRGGPNVVRLQNNKLTTLPLGFFEGITASSVTVRLEGSDLSWLPPGIFEGLDLRVLVLDSNQFQSLPEGLFTGIGGNGINGLTADGNLRDLPLTVTLEQADDVRGVMVRVAQGVPREATFTLTVGGKDTGVTIPVGGDRVTHPMPTAAAGTTVTLKAGTVVEPEWAPYFTGFNWNYDSQTLALPPDEGIRVSVTADSAPVPEGTAARFTVTASEVPAAPLMVTVEVSGDAASDELGRRERVIESPARTVTLNVTTAEVSGGAGAVTAAVRGGAGYEPGDAPAAVVAVTDTEADPSAILVWFTEQSDAVGEGDPVTLTLNANATTTSGLEVKVNVSGAVAPGEAGERTLTFGADDTMHTFPVAVRDDMVFSGHDALVATVVASSTYVVGIPSSIVVPVLEDERAPTGVSLSVSPEVVAEDMGATPVTVTARFEGGAPFATSTEVVVTLMDDMGRAGVTTNPAGPYTITIVAEMREGTQTFTVTPTPDAGVYGGDGRLTLSGTHSSLPVEGATVFVRDSIFGGAMVSVAGDAGLTPAPDLSYEGIPFSADEGASVTLTAASSFTGGTPAWAWSQVHGDEVWLHTPELETGEATLSLSLPNRSAAYTVHFRATATYEADTPLARTFTRDARIVVPASDDAPTILSALAEAEHASSSDTLLVAAGMEVTLRGGATDPDVDQRLTVGWSQLPGGPSTVTLTEVEAGSPEVVMFTAPETPGDYTFEFSADDDGDGGDDPITRQVVVRVLAAPGVRIRALSESVMEGEEARFELTWIGTVETAFTVNVALTGGENFGATSTAMVMVDVGDTAKSFGVETTDDGRAEDNATLRATLEAGDGYVVIMPDFAEMTITDNGMSPDVNGDDEVNANDALILYYAYSLRSSLGTGR